MSAEDADGRRSSVFLRGGGETGARIRSLDWAATPLGAPDDWPESLKTLAGVMLSAGQPMFIAWGPSATMLFNDGYVALLGSKRDTALGRPFMEVWSEAKDDLTPLFDRVYAGDPVQMDDITLYLDRGAGLAEAHFAFSYTPVRDAAGGVLGLFCACSETTEQVLASRRMVRDRARQQQLMQQMPGFVAFLHGPDHIYDYVNDAYVRISGIQDFVGRAVRDVFPDPQEQFFCELLDGVYATGEPFAASALPIPLASQERFIDLLCQPIREDDGTILGLFVGGYDVTDRISAQQALAAVEVSSSQVLDATSEAFYAVDCDGVTTLCNAAFLTMLGFARREDVIGRAVHGLIHHSHPDGTHYARADCPIYRAAATGTPAFVNDELFFRLDGTSFPVEYRAEPIHIGGVLTGAICTFTDITERKATEAALRASEAEFRTFAQAMPNQVWAAGADGMLDWFNDRIFEYSGMDAAALGGSGWVAMVHPDDAAEAGVRWAAALATGETYQTEFRLRRVDGVYRWHIARALPIVDGDGRITRWIGTNTEIEAQKETATALARLNATLEEQVAERTADRDRIWRNSQDLLVVLDTDGKFRSVNPSATRILGWTEQELIGRPLFDFLMPDDTQGTRGALHEATRHDLHSFENRYRHKDGGFRWFSWVATPDAGLIYASGRHITAEKEAAARLMEIEDALRQSQKMEAVGQLTGGIAHDFNNMLAVVIGSLDLLSRRIAPDDARARRYVDAASDGARRAALLTQRLLAFSRQQPLQPETIDINTLAAGMSDLLRHALGADVRLETVLAGGLWRTHVDPNQLENVILNLAVNARDAMPDGGRLTIETQNTHLDAHYAVANVGVQPGQYVMIAVTDTGSGMPPEVIAKAFDPFFTTKEVGKGTGLGLSQAYGFVKQSGGHVKIYSEAGQGTTLKLYLPRHFAQGEERAAETAKIALPQGDRGEVILVVDDEPAVRQFSADALSELGYAVIVADGADRALQLLAAHPEIVLMFTDVVMPDVNGRKLADEALRRHPKLRVLFTTGYTRNAVVHNGVLDADVALISKPFTIDELAARMRAVLDAGP